MKVETSLAELKAIAGNYDWTEVFKYGVNPISLDTASRETFTLDEVAKVYGSVDGENDERDWVMVGKLKDGRYFQIQASCDYTGWGCQEGGDAVVASKLKLIIAQLDKDQKERLSI